jgi:hypothetical protein
VIAAGAALGVIFVLVELTGSDIDKQASEAIYTAFAVLLFTILGSTGIALAHLQPRYALFGAVTAILSPLAFGATVVSLWSNGPFLFGFGFRGTSGTVGGITVILAITAAAISVLLATARRDEDSATHSARVIGIGALALFVALAILSIVDHSVDISSRAYAIIATVYVVASVVSLVLRLLPAPPRVDEPTR